MEAPSDHDIVHALGEDLPVGIWIARAPGGELIYANRAFVEILGAAAPDGCMVGSSERYGLCTRDGGRYPETRLPFARAVSERCLVVVDDLAVRRRDGTQVDVRAVAQPVGDPISHVITTVFDIGREVAARRAVADTEVRLRRAQRLEAVGALADGIAHDFNNLIFGVKLIAAELAVGEHDPKRRAALELIDDITERSATLTRSLLGFTRRGEHRAMPISVTDVVTSMSELLTRTLAGVELSFELEAADRGTVVADQTQLEQVILSLVLHARAARRVVVRTGDAVASANPEARFVVLEVKDDGPGIQPRSAAADVPDQGTDLAAVFGIVERHGGSVEVDAGLDDRGTTMRVLWPALRRTPTMRPRVAPPDLPRGSATILVVDDDHMVRKVVSSSLGSLGYKIIEAASGKDAVEIYRARHDEIRAVVLDMVMPELPGRATYLALREIDREVAVLLMSGHTMNEEVQEILDLGVRSFVSKPYSIAVLATAIAELTRQGG